MHNKNPLYITIALVVGLIIGSCITSSFASIKRMRTIPERIEYLDKHEKGLTMIQFNIRLKKVEAKIKQLERSK